MLQKSLLKEKKPEIEKILSHHNISPEECKIFGDIIDKPYPISANLHFLITPSSNCSLTEGKWEMFKQAIEDLFPSYYILFYTPDILDSLVKFKQLKPEYAELAKKDAEPLTKIFEEVLSAPSLNSPISQSVSAPSPKKRPSHTNEQKKPSSAPVSLLPSNSINISVR
jgi:hypothetical protein